ncbi:tetraspanin-13-like [Styela clava]
MCGGFNCSKNALTALNILFLLVSFVLIGTASYAKAAGYIYSFEIAGGIIACGLFLFFISILGLIASSKHHQVLLFFYFVVLFLLFLIQFSVSIACLALSKSDEKALLQGAWNISKPEVTDTAETLFHCCGWNETDLMNDDITNHCENELKACVKEVSKDSDLPKCQPCSVVLTERVSTLLVATGGIGFFFSLMELMGVYLAVRFRNQKDPKANPSQFL